MVKLCLAANAGGHLNQLLQLEDFYKQHDYFFVTDRTEFAEEVARTRKVYFVERFIFREVLRKWQLLRPLINFCQSFAILCREKPDVIITTGAATAFGSCIAAKLLRKKLIFIESVARVNGPSTFGKMLTPLADMVLVQWKQMKSYYSDARYAGFIFDLSAAAARQKSGDKNNRIFVTTGTYRLQFDRVLRELDRLKGCNEIPHQIVGQIGASTYKPKCFETFAFGNQQKVHQLIDASDIVICHGGSGSIMDSLMRGKTVIAVPRRTEFKEFFDDHQLQIVSELERQGLVLAVYDIKELSQAIRAAEGFEAGLPRSASDMKEQLQAFLERNLA